MKLNYFTKSIATFCLFLSAQAYSQVNVGYAGVGDKTKDLISLACTLSNCPSDAKFIYDAIRTGDIFDMIESSAVDEAAYRQQWLGGLTSDSHTTIVMTQPFSAPIYSKGAPSYTKPDAGGTRLFTSQIAGLDGEQIVVGSINDGIVIGATPIGAQSNGRPDIAEFKSKIFVTYNGLHSRRIYVARFREDGSVENKALEGSSSSAPTFAVFKDTLYIFYRGKKSKKISYTFSSDGINWSPERRVSSQWESSHSPYAAVMGDRLYLAYKGGSTNYISMTSTSDGTTWKQEHRLPTSIETDKGPALAAHNGELFVFFKGKTSDRVLYSSSLNGGSTWSQWQETGAHTSESLSAVSGNILPGPVNNPAPPVVDGCYYDGINICDIAFP